MHRAADLFEINSSFSSEILISNAGIWVLKTPDLKESSSKLADKERWEGPSPETQKIK